MGVGIGVGLTDLTILGAGTGPSFSLNFAACESPITKYGFTYTRSSTALVTNHNGALYEVPANALRYEGARCVWNRQGYSEDISNWTTTRMSVSADSATAPTGAATADKLIEDGTASSSHFVSRNASSTINAGNTITCSFYAKAGERTQVGYNTDVTTGLTTAAVFDLSSGLVVTPGSFTATIQSVGSGWYRCVCTGTVAASFTVTSYIRICVGGATSYSGDGTSGIYIWGAQVETGATASDYVSTNVLSSPFHGFGADGYKVFGDYAATGIVVEESSTNLLTYSGDLTNAAWTKASTTATQDQAGPDGGATTATRITATGANGTVLQSLTRSSAARISSCYIKRVTGSGTVNMTQDNGTTWAAVTVTASWTRVEIASATAANPIIGLRVVTSGDEVAVWGFQHEEKAFVTSVIPTTTASATRSADALSLTGAAGRTNLIVASDAPATQNVTTAAVQYTLSQTGSGTITLTGTSTAGPLVGAGSLTFTPSAGTLTLTMSGSPAQVQLETGATATAYIPTTTGPRSVENVASWFNGDAGTVYAEATNTSGTAGTQRVWYLDDNSSDNRHAVHKSAGSIIGQALTVAGGSTQLNQNFPGSRDWSIGTRRKVVYAFRENDFALHVDGNSITPDTSGIMPAGIRYMRIGSDNTGSQWNGTIARIAYYPRRLSNAELQAITT